jgi:hypothetical protein
LGKKINFSFIKSFVILFQKTFELAGQRRSFDAARFINRQKTEEICILMYNFDEFMRRVKQCNPNFKRFTPKSDLDPLLNVLNKNGMKWSFNPMNANEVRRAVHGLKTAALVKYRQALVYLAQELKIDPGAIPSNPKMKYTKFKSGIGGYTGKNSAGQIQKGDLVPSAFAHEHVLTWESSNGDMQALQTVGTREHVKHRTHPGSPPFNQIQGNVQAETFQGATTNNGGSVGRCVDEHSMYVPWVICRFPRTTGSVIAEQWYQYTCDGVTWHNIPGAAFLIEKGVRAGGPTGHLMYFKKTNWFEHNQTKFHFEVEYVVAHPPAFLPQTHTDVTKGAYMDDDINKHAFRVVAAG